MDPSTVYSSPFLEGAGMSTSTNLQLPSGLGFLWLVHEILVALCTILSQQLHILVGSSL